MREIIRLVTVLTVLCVLAAMALARVYEFTKDPIVNQRRLAKLRAVEAVIPEHENQPDQDTVTIDIGEGNKRLVYRGTLEGQITGIAFEVSSSKGYGGEVVAMLGLDPNGLIYGIEIVRHSETPGLGAKITTPEFRSQFKGRSISNTKFMLKKDGGDIDQVTGATTSPRAIVKAIREGMEFFNDHKDTITEDKG
ncbi:RnfABCDGE type electron transport complex subunit G [bacterium]|nr:RnfABCDGE type electron transport complex subunit G [bacterium]